MSTNMLTLEKFEEASEVVKKVTSEQVLFTWTNPTDEDFAGVQITIWTASSPQQDIKLEKNDCVPQSSVMHREACMLQSTGSQRGGPTK